MLQRNNYNRRWPVAAAAILLALASPAGAQADGPQAWQPVDAETGRLTGITDLQALLFMFPDSASVRRRLLNAYLEAERPADALNEAVELVKRGYAFSPAARELLLSLGPTDEQRATLALQDANASPLAASRPVSAIPAGFELVESVWRDPASGDLFATTVVSRKLVASRAGGEWREIPLAGAGSLSGMAYDEAHRMLWVASGVFDETPSPGTAFRGLIAVDPATGAERGRLAAPAGVTLSDLAVGAAGEVYASDPFSGAVYVARPESEAIEVLLAPGTLRSPQGIAPLEDGRRIIVSDYSYGLALVDTGTGAVNRIALDAPASLDGIDALLRSGDSLVPVQNGHNPMRIVRLEMSEDWHTVRAVTVLERAHPAWTEPVGAALSNGELVYVATGQWATFAPGGAVREGRAPAPSEVRVLPLAPQPAILHYLRSNSDGSLPEHVVQFRPDPTRIEVYKWVEKCTGAAYVTADFDARALEPVTLFAGKVGPGGEQERFGTLSLDPASRRLTMALALPEATFNATTESVGAPWYLFDYDLADLNAALQERPPSADFAFDLMLLWPAEDGSPSLVRVGRIEALHRGIERDARVFDLSLGEELIGRLWTDPDKGFILEARIERPNHAEYKDFVLRLERIEHGEAAWRELLAGHYRDCPAE